MSNLGASSPADPQVLTLFQEELSRAAALPGLAPAGPAIWPRFAGYYQGLARLPRRLRRALQRRWRRSLGGIALLCALGQAPALAATIVADGTTCTLVDAITAANSDTATGGCSAGSGADTIAHPIATFLTTVNNDTYGPTGLPVITSAIVIEGSGSGGAILRDSGLPAFRIVAVGATGNLTLLNTTVSGGVGFGGGGGISSSGTLTLTSSQVANSATFGGGGGIASTGTLTLTDSAVDNNSARLGGGGIHNGGTLTLTRCRVSGNSALYGASGILSGEDEGTVTTLTHSTVYGNSAGDGGGTIQNFGTLTLTDSTVSGNSGGGIVDGGTLTLTNSTIAGNTGVRGGGVYTTGTATLTNSTISGNTAGVRGGGIATTGTATLANSTVSGNSAQYGGGIDNFGTLTLTNSPIEGNSAETRGGGIYSAGFDYQGTHYAAMLTLTNITVSDNTAGLRGGGIDNGDTLTLTNSTISGNTAADRGGGVGNTGTATFTNSTIARNVSGRIAGGLLNSGNVTLVQSLLSGNTAPANGPEAYSFAGTVTANGFNVVGHDGSPGVLGFTLGATDVAPAVPLDKILDPTLGYNFGSTQTHALVFGSPAVDVVFGAPCVTTTDQRGAPRPQDGDGDSFNDCDAGAVERGQIPVQATLNSTRVDCRTAACRVPVTCNLTEAECINKVEITVSARSRRISDGTAAKAARPISFAFGAANIPPGGSGTVTLTLTKRGKRLVRETEKRRLKGVLAITEIATTVSNTPLTISRTDVTIRLKRRK